jgi:hypothetical protein
VGISPRANTTWKSKIIKNNKTKDQRLKTKDLSAEARRAKVDLFLVAERAKADLSAYILDFDF